MVRATAEGGGHRLVRKASPRLLGPTPNVVTTRDARRLFLGADLTTSEIAARIGYLESRHR
jgi:hypothetical protein